MFYWKTLTWIIKISNINRCENVTMYQTYCLYGMAYAIELLCKSSQSNPNAFHTPSEAHSKYLDLTWSFHVEAPTNDMKCWCYMKLRSLSISRKTDGNNVLDIRLAGKLTTASNRINYGSFRKFFTLHILCFSRFMYFHS